MANQQVNHLLVIRFSSLGDVAMTVPVLKCLLSQYPHLTITVVSSAFTAPLFRELDRTSFVSADLKGKHKGLPGIYKLLKEIRSSHPFDAVADLHNVIRTKFLRTLLAFQLVPKAAIDKGRAEKKAMTGKNKANLRPLKSTFERYAEVFAKLGFPVDLRRDQGIVQTTIAPEVENLRRQNIKAVGIAPIALHREKTYPLDKMKEVVRMLSAEKNIRVYLFGGKKDAALLEAWEKDLPHVISLAGKMEFEKELSFIAALALMVSMDSANMHFASLYGVPVVSVWGGTHPYLGFYGWGQDPVNAVQVDLECRPSSVFGNKPCYNDLACMKNISPILIFDRIMKNLEVTK